VPINADWHRAHRLPARATEAERIAWHLEHAAHCACRAIPPRLLARMRELGLEPPAGPSGGPGERETRRR
jgi:hypothetical protein